MHTQDWFFIGKTGVKQEKKSDSSFLEKIFKPRGCGCQGACPSEEE